MNFPERAARNEEAFRGVNQQIEAGARRHGLDVPMPFHCECDREACFARIDLVPTEYQRIVDQRYWFLVASGHDDPRVERAIEHHEAHTVVEKIGEARAALDKEHPQERHQN
ncbi:MAG TPA: hypothetical protein VGU02_13085 [Gaiellaceae bacterium]|nr:hypothetical protein [Gaiellaceae bacterium]